MEKIIVAQHCNQLGLGGTEKTMQLFCKYLDKAEFEVHALAPRFPVPRVRMWVDAVKSAWSASAASRARTYRLLHARAPEFQKILGPSNVHFYTPESLPAVLAGISPHILHLHHSGGSEPPLNRPDTIGGVPVLFSTNVFGGQPGPNDREKLARILFISRWLQEEGARWSRGDPRCGTLYYPIEPPCAEGGLRGELGIPPDVFVVGRVGRNADDIHDPISLRAYKRIEGPKTLFLALSAPERMKKDARALGVRNIRYLDPTVDDVFLSRFYNTINAMGHARLDGETFGCVIAEAMIHGKPVVTHLSHIRNAQAELVDSGSGFVVDRDDWQGYAVALERMRDDPALRAKMGAHARERAWQLFEAKSVTRKLEAYYREELTKRGIKNGTGPRLSPG